MRRVLFLILFAMVCLVTLCSGEDDFMCNFMKKGYDKYADWIVPDSVLDHFLQLADTSLRAPRNKSDLYLRRNKIHLQFEDLLWPNGVVPIEFGVGKKLEDRVWKILRTISDNTCVTFVAKNDTHDDFVHIRVAPYISTYIGRVGGRQDVTVELVAAQQVLHVFLHVLGFVHQHQSQDRDNFVEVYEENVKDGFRKDYSKLTDLDQSFGVTYEYDSVSHYSHNYGAIYDDKDTMIPKDPDMQLYGTYILSPGDVWRINAMYQCPDFIDLNLNCE